MDQGKPRDYDLRACSGPPTGREDDPEVETSSKFGLHPAPKTSNPSESLNTRLYKIGNGENPFSPEAGVRALYDASEVFRRVRVGAQGTQTILCSTISGLTYVLMFPSFLQLVNS